MLRIDLAPLPRDVTYGDSTSHQVLSEGYLSLGDANHVDDCWLLTPESVCHGSCAGPDLDMDRLLTHDFAPDWDLRTENIR